MIMTGISITKTVVEHGPNLQCRGKIRNVPLSVRHGQKFPLSEATQQAAFGQSFRQ
jgi:hypothetical protein